MSEVYRPNNRDATINRLSDEFMNAYLCLWTFNTDNNQIVDSFAILLHSF
jgi:hypothetical protein